MPRKELIKQWGGKGDIFVIAGPCSAETPDQVMSTAMAMDVGKVDLFRAGIWKPRTRPASFEGVGTEGLQWLKQVRDRTGMRITTEVANVKHVYEALKAGVDVLWIGARTTANPFAVQEIADALRGVDIPVLVKNPVSPDLNLWIGAIERLYKAGVRLIGAVHRGFSFYGKSKYRNTPHWQIALDLKREMLDILMVNDPSHISGRSDLVPWVAQKAMDLNFDGLMIEVHINPPQAWSDAKQQLTPQEFNNMIDSLIIRKEDLPDDNQCVETLEELRDQIDLLDNELINIVANRMEVVKKIGEWKKKNNVSVYQSSRFEKILDYVRDKARQYNLSERFIETVFKAIHEESINKQSKIVNNQDVREGIES